MGKSIYTLVGKGKAVQEAREQVEELEREQAKLLQLKENVESDAFVEKEVRDKLGLVKEGEVVVVLPPDDVLRKLSPSFEEEITEPVLPIWMRWSHLFFEFKG